MFDTRARDLRFVSAFSKDDLPTFERPAKAISGAPGPGKSFDEALAKKKSQGSANKSRPVSKKSISSIGFGRRTISPSLPLSALEGFTQIIPQFEFYARARHDDALLNDR